MIAGSFYEWIQRPDTRKIYLADLSLVRKSAASGTPETRPVYFSTEFFTPPPGTVTEYPGYLIGIPRYERRIQEVFSGQSFPSFGPLILANDKGTLDSTFVREYTKDQPVTIRLGGPPEELRYAHFGTVMSGIMGPQILRDAEVEVPVFDDQRKLRRKIPTRTFQGTVEGINFPSGNEGVSIPIIYGEVHNFSPIQVNSTTLKYVVAGHSCNAIGTVYDNGIDITPNATLNLNDADGRTSFTLSARPAGILTCDVRGRNTQAGTYTDRLGGVIEAILRQEASFNADEIDLSTLNQLKSDVDFPVGIAVTEPREILDIIDNLIAGLLVFYGMSRSGTFQMSKFKVPAGPAKLGLAFADDVEVKEPFEIVFSEPRWRVQLGYDTNETEMVGDSVAGSVTEQRRSWLSQPFRSVAVEDSAIKDLHNYAEEEDVIVTRLVRRQDTVTAANDRLSLLKEQRTLVTAGFGVQPTILDLGEVVNFERPRYDISGFWRVTGIRENYIKNTVDLELYK